MMLMRDSGALPEGTSGLIAGLLSCRSANSKVDEDVRRNHKTLVGDTRDAPKPGAALQIPMKPRSYEQIAAALAARTRERDAALSRVRELEEDLHRLAHAQGHAVPTP